MNLLVEQFVKLFNLIKRYHNHTKIKIRSSHPAPVSSSEVDKSNCQQMHNFVLIYESVNGGSSVQNSVDFRCQWIFYRKLHVLHDTIAVAFNNRFYSHLTFQIREYVPLHISINFGSQNDSF